MKNFLIILCMLVVIGGTGYSIYYQVENHNKDNNIPNEINNNDSNDNDNNKDEESLDVNSELVKNLYNYVSFDKWLDILEKNNTNKLETKNLNQELKNYIGYRQIPNSKIKSDSCKNYPNITSSRICGSAADAVEGVDGTWDSTNSSTQVISENDLKEAVETVFGNNSYNQVSNFGISSCTIDQSNDYRGYEYDTNSKNYVYYDGMAGCSNLPITKQIVSAEKVNDTLIIVENQKIEQDAYNSIPKESLFNQNIKYTFIYENGNYYFSSIEKVSE